jgi:hypothetical protein
MSLDILRKCRFQPYRKGAGPVFSLVMWDTHRSDNRGCTVIGYRLTAKATQDPRYPDHKPGKRETVFEGENYSVGMGTADDSDAAVAGLMGFLCLRRGDTDEDYFKDETGLQRWFRESHAEALQMVCLDRFGDL